MKLHLCYAIAGLYFVQSSVGSSKVNPDEFLNTPQIIRRHGYPSESYTVETEDGYLLTIHRIPGSKNGTKGVQPILLQHGFLCSSADWIEEGNSSLGFLLADEGYDVWLGNARGNIYSIGHTTLTSDSKEFWNFSWHEMGIYDLPAVIKFISNITEKGGEILYVGHSMGATMFYVFSSLKPETAQLVKFMASLAPVAYMKHVRSPIKYFGPFLGKAQWIADHLGLNQFLPSSRLNKYLTYLCKTTTGSYICENIVFALYGADDEGYNKDIMPVVMAHVPAGTSTKTVLHFGQLIISNGNFQQYDYGTKGNLAYYGETAPPLYNLTKIQVPIYLMYSANDYMAGLKDVQRLSEQLKNLAGMYLVPLRKFNHLDFLYGKDAVEVVYEPLLETLKKYN